MLHSRPCWKMTSSPMENRARPLRPFPVGDRAEGPLRSRLGDVMQQSDDESRRNMLQLLVRHGFIGCPPATILRFPVRSDGLYRIST